MSSFNFEQKVLFIIQVRIPSYFRSDMSLFRLETVPCTQRVLGLHDQRMVAHHGARELWPRGVPDKLLGGEVRPGPQTLNLFKTKIVPFLIPCLKH